MPFFLFKNLIPNTWFEWLVTVKHDFSSTGERCHERYHVRFAADQQREDSAELGAPIYQAIPWGQRSQLHHQLDRWTCL